MYNGIKVSLDVELPGGVMLSEGECLKTTQGGKVVENRDKTSANSLSIEARGRREALCFRTRGYRPARKRLSVSEEAWAWMVGSECPRWRGMSQSRWKKMTRRQRLEEHLRRLAEDFGGRMLGYEVFGD